MISLSPCPIITVALPPMLMIRGLFGGRSPSAGSLVCSGKSPSSSRSFLIHKFLPLCAGSPPCNPYGCLDRLYSPWVRCHPSYEQRDRLTSLNIETCRFCRNSNSLTTPSPPLNSPLPPDPSRISNRCSNTGYRLSNISRSPILVLVM
jgi:hypothetical protein